MNRMRSLFLAFLLGIAVSASAWAADNSTLPVSGGGTEVFANKEIGGVKFPKSIPYDSGGGDMTDTTNHALRVIGIGTADGAAATGTGSKIQAMASGATGGLLAGVKMCDSHAKYDASDNGSKTLVTGVSGRKVYVCGFILATGGSATNLKLREGSDADCATNGADLTPAYQLAANDRVGANSPFWNGLVVSTAAYYVCVNASAGNAHQAEVWYTIQ